MSTAEPITLPICTVQHDFESLVSDVNDGLVPDETFWASCYKTGAESVHGKVRLALNERNRDVVDYSGVGGVEFKDDAQVSYVVPLALLFIPPAETQCRSFLERFCPGLSRACDSIYEARNC